MAVGLGVPLRVATVTAPDFPGLPGATARFQQNLRLCAGVLTPSSGIPFFRVGGTLRVATVTAPSCPITSWSYRFSCPAFPCRIRWNLLREHGSSWCLSAHSPTFTRSHGNGPAIPGVSRNYSEILTMSSFPQHQQESGPDLRVRSSRRWPVTRSHGNGTGSPRSPGVLLRFQPTIFPLQGIWVLDPEL